MAHDFRVVKEAAKEAVKRMNEQDANWKWRVVVNKGQIKIFWGYLEYLGETSPFIITDGSAEKEECDSDDDCFIVLRNEHDEYMDGRIIGIDPWIGLDGTFENCVKSLINELWEIANKQY